MSDALALTDTPAGPPATTKVRVPATAKGKEIRGKLKQALDLMVWEGKPWLEAAKAAGYDGKWMRKALERPHVIRYVRDQRQVFRSSASAQNIHRATQIRDQDENRTAAIQAIRYLDGLGSEDAAREGQRSVSPGVVVQVNVTRSLSPADDQLIEVNASPAALEAADNDPQP